MPTSERTLMSSSSGSWMRTAPPAEAAGEGRVEDLDRALEATEGRADLAHHHAARAGHETGCIEATHALAQFLELLDVVADVGDELADLVAVVLFGDLLEHRRAARADIGLGAHHQAHALVDVRGVLLALEFELARFGGLPIGVLDERPLFGRVPTVAVLLETLRALGVVGVHPLAVPADVSEQLVRRRVLGGELDHGARDLLRLLVATQSLQTVGKGEASLGIVVFERGDVGLDLLVEGGPADDAFDLVACDGKRSEACDDQDFRHPSSNTVPSWTLPSCRTTVSARPGAASKASAQAGRIRNADSRIGR